MIADIIGDTSTFYLTQGVLGVTCIILGIVVFFLYKELKKSNNDRITDLKEFRDKLIDPIDKQTGLMEKVYDLLLNRTSRR